MLNGIQQHESHRHEMEVYDHHYLHEHIVLRDQHHNVFSSVIQITHTVEQQILVSQIYKPDKFVHD